MSKGCLITSVVVGIFTFIVFAIVMYFVSSYNSMITLNENAENAWSQVENQYQRRFDLIPNLVNTVKGYASHEKETFIAVTEARSKISQINLSAKDLNDPAKLKMFQAAQDGLSGALSKLMVVVEKYPDLKANENFLALQSQLEGTENRISVERRKFNDECKTYNIKIKKFPANFIAGMFGFTERPYYQGEEGTEKAPKVEF
jgi:LemA protein